MIILLFLEQLTYFNAIASDALCSQTCATNFNSTTVHPSNNMFYDIVGKTCYCKYGAATAYLTFVDFTYANTSPYVTSLAGNCAQFAANCVYTSCSKSLTFSVQ